MLRSIELQGITTQAINELSLVVSALYEAVNVVPCDYENLETHAHGALSIIEANIERLIEVDRALGNDFPCEQDAEGVE